MLDSRGSSKDFGGDKITYLISLVDAGWINENEDGGLLGWWF